MIPENFQLLFDARQIEKAVESVASGVGQWAEEVWNDSHTDIIAVPILRGALFFFADLVRCLPQSVEIFSLQSRAYELGINALERKEVEILGNVPARGRRVLLVDDICDTGRTLSVLSAHLLDAGALEVRSAVLIRRIVENPQYIPEWSGVEYSGTEWLVGYGMEDSERWRNLPSVYTIQRPSEE